jgi:hypothetical protein
MPTKTCDHNCGCGPVPVVDGAEEHKEDCALFEPDWEHGCEVCAARPIVPLSGMCGPCTFGEAETIGGNW